MIVLIVIAQLPQWDTLQPQRAGSNCNYSFFDTEQGTAPLPIGQTAMNEMRAVYYKSDVCLYSRGDLIYSNFQLVVQMSELKVWCIQLSGTPV